MIFKVIGNGPFDWPHTISY